MKDLPENIVIDTRELVAATGMALACIVGRLEGLHPGSASDIADQLEDMQGEGSALAVIWAAGYRASLTPSPRSPNLRVVD